MSISHLKLDREAILNEIIREHLKTKYNLSEKKIKQYFKEPVGKAEILQVFVPVSIFNDILSPLEAIVKYLKEVRSMKIVDIAKLTGRDQRAIGVTYKSASRKMPEQYTDESSDYTFPAQILQDKKLSVAEHIVKHIKETYDLSYHEIAVLMKRDDRTIWTLYNRASKKI